MNLQTIVLIGRSGCGKGTQAELLQEYFKKNDPSRPMLYVETGVQFREFIKGSSYSSRLSNEVYTKNDRQPDFLAIWNWARVLVDKMTGDEHVIIDGTPRSLSEAKVFDTSIKFYNRPATIVFLDISRAEAERRLMNRGRVDDQGLAKIAKRLDWFDSDVMPAIQYFKDESNNNFLHIQAEKPVEEVFGEIVATIERA
jgi:adenylate kinase family enzyme